MNNKLELHFKITATFILLNLLSNWIFYSRFSWYWIFLTVTVDILTNKAKRKS